MKNAKKRPEKAAKNAEEPWRALAPADLPNYTVTDLEFPPGGQKMQLFGYPQYEKARVLPDLDHNTSLITRLQRLDRKLSSSPNHVSSSPCMRMLFPRNAKTFFKEHFINNKLMTLYISLYRITIHLIHEFICFSKENRVAWLASCLE